MQSSRTVYEYNPAQALARRPGFGIAVLAILHVLLALAMRAEPYLATLHALATLTVGIFIAIFSRDRLKVGYVAAYMAGSEVLWRMTNARVFWESGKYFTILILGIALLRINVWRVRPRWRAGLPILYFLLLCFSIPTTLSGLGFSGAASDAISFNLSGPFALMVCALYFSQVTLDPQKIQRLAWWAILPILCISTLALYGTLASGKIVFTGESNFTTSGGFGPNQVSALLGLGGGLALILFLMGKDGFQRAITLLLAAGLLVQSALTFSRGGLYNAGIMLVLVLVHYVRSPRGRAAALVGVLGLGLAGGYLVYPRLNVFTGGMLEQRFASLDTTTRIQIAQADLNVWLDHPILGVGPGMAKIERLAFYEYTGAEHTEYTRLLAEHGIAGLLALLVLLSLVIRTYQRAPGTAARIWVVALLAWPLMEMTHAAMRVVAISFLFGLALVNWNVGEKTSQGTRNLKTKR